MHTSTTLLLAATAFAIGCAAVPHNRPRERGLFIEDNTTLSSLTGSQVSSTELPNHDTTAGGFEKNNATQATIKTSDVLSLLSSPYNISARTSSHNKKLTDIDLSAKTINKTEELLRTHAIPIHQSLRNGSSQSNNTNKTKVSNRSKSNSRNHEVVPLQPKTIPKKLSNEDASADRSLVGLANVVKILKLIKSNVTNAEQQSSHSVPRQNASHPANREEKSEKISVDVAPLTSTVSRSAASNPSISPHELNTLNGTNINRKAENRIKIVFSGVDSNIDLHSCHAVQDLPPPSQVERNPDDNDDLEYNDRKNGTLLAHDDDGLEINDRKNGTLLSPKSVEKDISTGDHVFNNEPVS